MAYRLNSTSLMHLITAHLNAAIAKFPRLITIKIFYRDFHINHDVNAINLQPYNMLSYAQNSSMNTKQKISPVRALTVDF